MSVMTQHPAKEKINTLLGKTVVNGAASFRKEARLALEDADIPGAKTEDWKYTRMTKWLNESYQNSENIAVDLASFASYENLCVFVNGKWSSSFSRGKKYGSSIETVKALPYYQHSKSIFTALNGTFFTDGISIQESTSRLAIVHFSSGNSFSNTHHHLKVPKGQAVSADIYFLSDSELNFSNVVLQAEVEENAQLSLNIFQNEGEKSAQVNLVHAYQHQNSQFTINTISTGGLLTRNDLNIVVDGQNCESILNGVYLTHGKQHIDNHTLVDHRQPHCHSNEKYKGIMNDQSTGVFNGKVFVRQDAQKINAYQSNQNILLSDDATINSKPELEIYADDVKCSHGSTTGQLDEEAMFYLRARGIGRDAARKLLVEAFLHDVIDEISSEPFRGAVEKVMNELLHNGKE